MVFSNWKVNPNKTKCITKRNTDAISNSPKYIELSRALPMHFKWYLMLYQTSFVMKVVLYLRFCNYWITISLTVNQARRPRNEAFKVFQILKNGGFTSANVYFYYGKICMLIILLLYSKILSLTRYQTKYQQILMKM